MKKILATMFAATMLTGTGIAADHHGSVEGKIKRAMSAAPMMISAEATIRDMDGTVLKEGSNGWTCYPGVPLMPGSMDPMCNDAVWEAFIAAALKGEAYEARVIGYSYMLQGDGMVNNDDPAGMDHGEGTWIQEGPHLMLLLPKSAMGDTPMSPTMPGPYVMWGNTPAAHIMVPVADRPDGALKVNK